MSPLFFAFAQHDTARQGDTLLSYFLDVFPGGPLLALAILGVFLLGLVFRLCRNWLYGAVDSARAFFAIGGHK